MLPVPVLVPLVPSAGLGLPMPLMLAERLMLDALNFSRLVRSVAERVPVVSWLRAGSAVEAMTPPVRVVAPPTRMSNPPEPALIPLCSCTLAKSPDCLVWPNESDAPAPAKPLLLVALLSALLKSAETETPTLVCLDLKTDVSCWLVIARLPACTSTRLPESCAPSRVRAPGVTMRAVANAE